MCIVSNLKLKHLKVCITIILGLQIPLSGDVEDNAHKVFFDFFEKYTQTT